MQEYVVCAHKSVINQSISQSEVQQLNQYCYARDSRSLSLSLSTYSYLNR